MSDIETKANRRVGTVTVEFNAKGALKWSRNEKDNATVFHDVGLAGAGVMNRGYRSNEEQDKMTPYLNGLVVLDGHPPSLALEQVIAADLANPEQPALGSTENAREDEDQGLAQGKADVIVWDVDRAGNSQAEFVQDIKDRKVTSVSIGYTYTHIEEEGEFNGEKYDHVEKDIKPYHLAILRKEQPACPDGQCGFGANSKSSPAEPGVTQDNDQGENHMTDEQENAPPAPGGQTTLAEQNREEMPVADMTVCAIAKHNAEVRALVNDKATIEEELTAAKEELEELRPAKEELDKVHEEQRTGLIDELKATFPDEATFDEKFPEDKLAEMPREDLMSVLDLAKTLRPGENKDGEGIVDQSGRAPSVDGEAAFKNMPSSQDGALDMAATVDVPENVKLVKERSG